MGPTESSPLVADGLVYVGDWTGKVYALSAATGRTVWSYQTGDKVKDGLALAGKHVYLRSYDSHVYALNARTGKLFWKTGAQQRLGPSGTFYSTPAVAYDRVYIGGTDGKMYSYGATSGKLRWSHGTGGYVYASPAVWNRRVFAGSYNGEFYCFDAATGDVCWKFKSNGPISGSAVVINGIDIHAKPGTPVYPIASGRAHLLSGTAVAVKTPGRPTFQYFHLKLAVHNGQPVRQRKTVLGYITVWAKHVHLSEIAHGRALN